MHAMKPPLNAQPNQSLIDGIATLQALAMSPEPIGSRELARQLGIDSTKVNRLLKTLAYLGIARQTANRKYTAGPGMHVLAAQSLFASGLIRRAHARGKQVHVWTVDDPDAIRRMLDAGVDGIITDRTDILRDVLVERGQWSIGS